jgi:hypothetical protein
MWKAPALTASKIAWAAYGSAKQLNSAVGDVFPGWSRAPPIQMTDLTRPNVVGSARRAWARLVTGVSGRWGGTEMTTRGNGGSRRRQMICEGNLDDGRSYSEDR